MRCLGKLASSRRLPALLWIILEDSGFDFGGALGKVTGVRVMVHSIRGTESREGTEETSGCTDIMVGDKNCPQWLSCASAKSAVSLSFPSCEPRSLLLPSALSGLSEAQKIQKGF